MEVSVKWEKTNRGYSIMYLRDAFRGYKYFGDLSFSDMKKRYKVDDEYINSIIFNWQSREVPFEPLRKNKESSNRYLFKVTTQHNCSLE